MADCITVEFLLLEISHKMILTLELLLTKVMELELVSIFITLTFQLLFFILPRDFSFTEL